MENKIDLSKFPKGSKIIVNAKGVEIVQVPYDKSYEEKFKGASSPKDIWTRVQLRTY